MNRFSFLCASLVLATPLLAQDVPPQPPVPTIPDDTEIVTLPSGLQYSVLQASPSGGPSVGPTDKVTVHYTGFLTDGTVFDDSRGRGEPATFRVGGVIRGWTEALQLMRPGDRYKLTIPSDLAYGESGTGSVPPDSTLIFDVELIEVVAGPPLPVFRPPVAEAQTRTESGLAYEILRAGEGEAPTENDVFLMQYAFWTAEGELVECTATTGQDLIASASRMGIPFLKEAPLLLKPGSSALFEVPAALAFGEQSRGALQSGATSIWRLDMVRVFRPEPVPEFSASAEEALVTTDSGLQYEVLREGEGARPAKGDRVLVHYAGWLTDGTLFDNSFQRGIPFDLNGGGLPVGLGRVIKGWDEGLQLMPQGSVYKFTIPSDLGYGPNGNGPIPGGATLVFLVEMVKVL